MALKLAIRLMQATALITSAEQGGMRLISVVMGTDSERARKVEKQKAT